jgi:endonuclease-8
MPEGDTIYRTARALEKALAGRVVTGFETGFAKLASVNDDAPVVGRVVEKVEARGKWCLIFLSGDLILLSHMLMSGSWHIYRTGERWRMPHRAMRVALTVGPQGLKPLASIGGFDGGTEVPPQQSPSDPPQQSQVAGFQNQSMQAVLFNAQVAEFHTARSLERSSQVPKLGPDVLAEGFTLEKGVAAMRERMRTHPEDEVAVVLLNQRVMAGLGNVYKSEVAFAAGVNPFRAMSTLSVREVDLLVEHSFKYMKANIGDGQRGESGDGIVTYTGPRRTTRSMDRGDRTWVYGRQGQECRRCGTAIERRLQGVAARPTYWCPVCQPWVAAAGQSVEAPVGRKNVFARRKVGC